MTLSHVRLNLGIRLHQRQFNRRLTCRELSVSVGVAVASVLCCIMKKAAEYLCCREIPAAVERFGELQCIVQHDKFSAVCLTPDVLSAVLILQHGIVADARSRCVVLRQCLYSVHYREALARRDVVSTSRVTTHLRVVRPVLCGPGLRIEY